MSFALILAENDGISIFGASILGASNLGMSNAGALGASGILKSILGACSNQPVSPVQRDNLFHALATRRERWHIHLGSVRQLRCVRHLKGRRLGGLCAHRSVSETRRDNLIHALGLTSNLGMSKAGALGASGILKSIFGASGSFGASGILKDGASGACAHIDQ